MHNKGKPWDAVTNCSIIFYFCSISHRTGIYCKHPYKTWNILTWNLESYMSYCLQNKQQVLNCLKMSCFYFWSNIKCLWFSIFILWGHKSVYIQWVLYSDSECLNGLIHFQLFWACMSHCHNQIDAVIIVSVCWCECRKSPVSRGAQQNGIEMAGDKLFTQLLSSPSFYSYLQVCLSCGKSTNMISSILSCLSVSCLSLNWLMSLTPLRTNHFFVWII